MTISTGGPMLLHRMIDEAALRRPEAPAVRCDGATLSYEQLARQANGLARVLLETGLARRDRVAVLLGKGLQRAGRFLRGARLGRDPGADRPEVPGRAGGPHPARRRVRRTSSRSQAEARCGSECARHLSGGVACDRSRIRRRHAVSMPSVGRRCPRKPATGRRMWRRSISIRPTCCTPRAPPGFPKLILHTHRSAMSFVEWAVAEYSLTRDDRLSNHSSHHTCFATFDYYAAARAGATTVILTPAVLMMPGSLAALLEQERVSVWYSVPTALVQLSLRGDLETRDLRSIRWVLFAGETFPEKHLRRIMQQLPGARFSHVYGSTEVNVCTYYHLPEAGDLDDPLPIGKACSNSSTLVVDDELRPVPDGEVGELLVRGSTVMSGYWGEPEKNRRVLVRQPSAGELEEVYFRTGDRVRVLDDGNLTFVARADRQVKVRGHRVELEEVETALLSLDPVEEAAVFTVPDGEGSSAIRAAVVVGDRRAVDSTGDAGGPEQDPPSPLRAG